MGGDDELMKFTGDIILDGGGFSSVRRRIKLDLSEYAGVVVTVQADLYNRNTATSPTGLHLQLGDSSCRYGFASAFAVPLSSSNNNNGGGNELGLTSVYLPIETFDRGGYCGWFCRRNCRFDESKINEMSVYVLFQEGDFDVRIHSIEAVKEPRAFLSPAIDDLGSVQEVVDLLYSTLSSGASLYNKSYVELCVAMYWSILNTLLASSSPSFQVPDSIQAVICAGLQEAEALYSEVKTNTNVKGATASTLWCTIDAVIADLNVSNRYPPCSTLNWLPTPAEAESMEVTCVGRTSLAEGMLYDVRV